MKTKLPFYSLLSLLFFHPLFASATPEQTSQEGESSLSSTRAPYNQQYLQDARIFLKLGDFERANFLWNKLISQDFQKTEGVTDKDVTKALCARIMGSENLRTQEDHQRIQGLISLLPQEHLIHAALFLEMQSANPNDVDLVTKPLFAILGSAPQEALSMMTSLRHWVGYYDTKDHPLAHKAYDTLIKMGTLYKQPLTAKDYLNRGTSYMREHVRSASYSDLRNARSSFETGGTLVTTALDKKHYHQGMAESLTLECDFVSFPMTQKQDLAMEAASHWHAYWHQLDIPSALECGIYVRGVITTNALLNQRNQNMSALEAMPDDLDTWDLLTLIYGTQICLETNDATKAALYWRVALKKANTPEEREAFAPFINNSFLEIGRAMAFVGEWDLAIETLQTNMKIVKDTKEKEEPRWHFTVARDHRQESDEEKLKSTYLLLSYAWGQKAIACTEPTLRKSYFHAAMEQLRGAGFMDRMTCTIDEMIRLTGTLYFIVHEAGTPQERKGLLPGIVSQLLSMGGTNQVMAPLKGTHHTRAKRPTPEEQGAKARTFLMATYGAFCDKHLSKLAHLTRKVELLDNPALSQAHTHLTSELKRLKDASKRPVRLPTATPLCLETTQLYNDVSGQMQAYLSLWREIEAEMAKARASLPTLRGETMGTPSSSISTAIPNTRAHYTHPKSTKKGGGTDKGKGKQRRQSLPSTPSSSSQDVTQDAAPPTAVHIVFSAQAESDKGTLLAMPGMAAKLDHFLDEIKDNPFATKIDMACGRPEALRFMKDHYSRRFNKQNRLVYRTDRGTDGSVTVTILRLLTHYGGLKIKG